MLLNAFDNSDEEEGNDDEEDDSLMSRVRGCFGLLSQTNKTNFRVSIVKAGASVYELQVLQSSSGASKDDRSLDNNNSEYAQMQLGKKLDNLNSSRYLYPVQFFTVCS